MLLYSLGESAYCYALLHVCVKNYFRSENFGCWKKIAEYLGSLKSWSDSLGV